MHRHTLNQLHTHIWMVSFPGGQDTAKPLNAVLPTITKQISIIPQNMYFPL